VEYPHVYRDEYEGIVAVGGYFYEQDTVPGLQGKYVFGDWTKDPQREAPAGRLLAATDPGDGGETTPEGTETTPQGTEATTAGDPGAQEQVVPRDQLWDMEELLVAGSDDGTLDWFVRQFGQGTDGEIYVLVSRRGIPEGDSGAVLQIVPPGEGDGSATATTTVEAGRQETVAGEGETTTQAGGAEATTEVDETTTETETETTTEASETTTEAENETTTEEENETTTEADALGTIERDR
jgi:hypothetical protein